jgi:hypothetical protein
VLLPIVIAAVILGGVVLLAKLPAFLNARRDADEQ